MYLLFPLFAWGSRRWKALPLLGWAVTMMVIMVIHHTVTFPNAAWGAVYFPLRALPAFLLGMAMFNYRSVIAKLPASRIVLGVGVIGLIASMLLPSANIVGLALTYVVVASAIACDLNRSSNMLLDGLAALGQLTYSIYMWHSLLILVLLNAIADKTLHLHGLTMAAMGLLCYLCIAAVSYLSYKYFETPARQIIDRQKLFAVPRLRH